MQPMLADLLRGPWAVQPDRLPFICAALASAACRVAEPPATPCAARTGAATSAARRRQGDSSAIAVLPFYGVAVQRADALGEAIGLLSLARFTQAFRAALADDAVSAILIDVDSPGGSVYGIAELAEEIYRARARKPIGAIANSLAASGAYWVASAAREFYVTPGGEAGSIGVVTAHQDVSKAHGKAGVETTLISAGKYKTEGNPFEPLGADARHHVQSRVDDYYRMFTGAVAKHRGVTESAVRTDFGRGRLLDAQRAKREGMVDGVATIDEVVRKLALLVGQGKIANASRVAAARQQEFDALARPIQDSNFNRTRFIGASAASESVRAVAARRARQRVIAILSL
ncbi:MAG: S49 family peptidase [Burkholderiales bacterium]|nr:S49 family peptidase [Burkholderiales bacterium]